MKSLVLLLIFISSGFLLLESDENKTEDKSIALLDEVMAEVCKKKFKSGFEKLKSICVLDPSDVDVFSSKMELTFSDPKFNKRYNNGDSYEFLSKKAIGNSLIKYTYIQKFDKSPFVWYFILYKKNETWQVISFDFSDKVKELFE